ncbi:hypothetical protein AWZ03_001488 [Drosophila navojoa]|uniref:Uncharacterized protein n=1 Tax=Drosophila navojoa TaxID=7232 RepID=A0A484BTU0_DRONA|nr:uncharacterized protein LOC108659777 [Drosophila navojoa]TDG52207.1 hypothetical protein AWZ03_001488 [Drosophila navojoa]
MRRPRQHNWNSILVSISIVVCFITGACGLFLFPPISVLQLTSSMSVPIDLPNRRVFMDLGFQMNYNLPFDLLSFYNPTIWPNAYERRRRRESYNFTSAANEVVVAESGIHPKDFTAGELYAGIERLLPDYGFHRSCLLRSVCELALHPMADDHGYSQNLFVQIINFVLTPSQHDGFGPNEKQYRYRYERAEKLGFMGGDCQKAYPKCELDLLSIMTKLVI